MEQIPISNSFFAENRANLLGKIEKEAIAILFSSEQKLRTGDQYYPYRQNSDFFYLTGIEQEESVLFLDSQNPDINLREVLFLLTPDEKMKIYDDKKLSSEDAATLSGINTIKPLSLFSEYLEERLKSSEIVYSQFVLGEGNLELLEKSSSALFAQELFRQDFSKTYKSINSVTTALRLIKHPVEIELIQKACDITDKVFKETILQVKPEMYEYEIDAILKYGFMKRGIKSLSFEPIIASGENALRLHYTKKDKRCSDGELLLFDIGCEYQNYCSDCSRTIPVNGKFTERQKACYNAVLNVFEKAKKLFIEGNTIASINQQALLFMAEELLALKLIAIEQYNDEEQRKIVTRKYLPHGISHYVGLDTHDVGAFDIPFEKGMVLTCEPGIYIQDEKIGIRIETMLLITDSEPYDFFSDTYLTIDEIEGK
ncbi:aminopeptidase P N-terminal domain-containing protein [Bacteroidales bacterium OttesenSCG-928-C19]|nr:aminopeptidase P N-terminal domain-containing protein [Bacteroidales bacterium OttesenSCG-928-C19]